MSEERPENAKAPQAPSTRGKVRAALNRIDHELVRLLAERRALSASMASIKDAGDIPLRDQEREEDVLVRVITDAQSRGLDELFVTRIFHTIFEDSIRVQERYLVTNANAEAQPATVRVAFEGGLGSYSYIAARQHFPSEKLVHLGCGSFKDAIEAVESGRADYAILPIENTTSGGINEVYDLFLHTSLAIIGEERVAVDHCLLAKGLLQIDEIRQIYAHPQAIAQCSRFLAGLRDCRLGYLETSEAIQKLEQGERNSAAIAGREAAKLFGLEIVEAGIANQADNYTRFLIAARRPRRVPQQVPCKTSLVMATSQKPGALVEALLLFRERGINLAKLESRPIIGNPWEEMFYLDLAGNVDSLQVQDALEALGEIARFVKVLGCYPSRDLPPTRVPLDRLGSTGNGTR